MPPRRRGRSTRRSAVIRKQNVARSNEFQGTPTPDEPSDHEMQDASPSTRESPTQVDESGVAEMEPLPDADDVNDDDIPATPENESEASVSRAGSPPPTRGRGRGRGRGRRGRPRVRPLGPDRSSKEGSQEASDAGTPKSRRGGWRGRGFGAGRWANRRAGGQRQDQLPQDAEGNPLSILNDEAAISDDPEGERKVDQNGNLLGGRQYRVRVFTVLGRDKRQYMLSTEPARCIGFRDSYLFFQKHRVLYKIILSDEEKMDLIERDVMPHSYKGRSIGVVTARSVFREFGAKIVIGGRNILDDYFPERTRENGAVEGELAVPEDVLPAPGQEYNRNQYVAWHGASAVYHTSGPTVSLQPGEKLKRKVPITSANWMLEHARQASRFNSRIGHDRQNTLHGVYDIHTNILLFPRITQPTHARWEPAFSQEKPTNSAFFQPTTEANGEYETLETPPEILQQPDPFISRNYMVADNVFLTPPASGLGLPGNDSQHLDVGAAGLVDVPEDVVEALPEVCRIDFLRARDRESNWRFMWHDESSDSSRHDVSNLNPSQTSFHIWSRDT